MSDDTERDDRALGAALSRAIDTQAPRETPFERSRLAQRIAEPRRGWTGTWLPVGAAIALVAAVALAAAVLGGRGDPNRVAVPGPTPTGTARPTSSPTTPSPAPAGSEALRVFFTRDQLPPVAGLARVSVAGERTPAQDIRARMAALPEAAAPAGAFNPSATMRAKVSDVRVEGDTAVVDFGVPAGGWGVQGSAGVTSLVQQLVYTATEQAGVRRVRITGNGRPAVIGEKALLDRPMTREDVFGYSFSGETERITFGTPDQVSDLSSRLSVDDFTPGLARLAITVAPRSAVPAGWLPAASIWQEQRAAAGSGKSTLVVQIRGGVDPGPKTTTLDRSPVRAIAIDSPQQLPAQGGTTYTLELDDARPWRVAVVRDPLRIVIDIGGAPAAVTKGIAVYEPRPGAEVDRTFTVRGVARTFEANVQWRLRDSSGRAVASGFTTASVGTSALWGTFETTVTAPAGTRGNVVLEVFETSARDGSEIHKVAIPVAIR